MAAFVFSLSLIANVKYGSLFFSNKEKAKSPSEQNLKIEVCLLLKVVLKGFAGFEKYRKMLTGKFHLYWL